MAKVKVRAAKRGTFVSPTRGSIHHFDPKGSDPLAREPEIEQADLAAAVESGFVSTGSHAKQVALPAASAVDPAVLKGVAAAAKIDSKAGVVASPAGQIATIAYPDSMGVGGDEAGITEGDPDAPPVPTRPQAANAQRGTRTSESESARKSTGRRAPARSGGRRSAAPKADNTGGDGGGAS